MKKTIFRSLLLVSATVTGFSCSESLLEEKPPHIITTGTLYTDYNGFEAGINGLYALVRQEREGLFGSSGQVTDLFMNGTDNLVTNHVVAGFNTIARLWGTANNPSDEYYSNAFIWLYSVINSANTIIAHAEKDEGIRWAGGGRTPEVNKNLTIAHAKAIRAWAYRHLTFGWGDVPLNLEETKGSTIVTDWTRTPVAVVRQQMITDWRFAEQHLTIEPVPGRISKGAVQHFLAEAYHVNNQRDSALHYVDQVIGTPAYRLITARYGVNRNQPGVPFMDMFAGGNTNREEGNTEALWVFQFEPQTIGGGAYGYERRHHHSRYVSISINGVSPLQITAERGGRGYGRMSLTQWAINNFEPGDDRGSYHAIRKFFVLKNAEQNAPYPADRLPSGYAYGDTIWLKWDRDITATANGRVDWPFSRKTDWADPNNVGGDPSYKDQTYLRLAETYLLKAEIQLAAGLRNEATATLNVLRRRAHAREIAANETTLDFILDERSRELVLEEHRRFTLLRTGKWLERTRAHNKNGGQFITEKDRLFPIPQTVIDANLTQKMTQNPGFN